MAQAPAAPPVSVSFPVPAGGLPARTTGRAARLQGLDALRGGVMVVMLLDHVRVYLSAARFDPTDLARTTAPLFLTRWVTHYCAPTFVLLAGMSAWLAGRRRTPAGLSRFLLSRGLWLVAVEFTLVSFGWYFNLEFQQGAYAQVIWAIGASMIVLAGLVRLPLPAVAAAALVMIGGHNLLDGVAPDPLGALAPLWTVLHGQGAVEWPRVFVVYPLIPWVGVLAAGYALAAWLDRRPELRPRRLFQVGVALTAGFVALRALDVYGDPRPWATQADAARTVLSFLNVTKYPPSLLFLMMTLGPPLLALRWLEAESRRGTTWLATYGQVPLFYYVVHIYLIHALAIIIGAAQGFEPAHLAVGFPMLPAGYGVGLPAIWALSALLVAGLYPACRWYAGVKRRGSGWWWSYL
jgi:uncharacterized membrane protein